MCNVSRRKPWWNLVLGTILGLGFVVAWERRSELQGGDSAWLQPLVLADADSSVRLWLASDRFGLSGHPRGNYGLPGPDDARLDVPSADVPLDEFPAPNGWSHRFPFVDFRHGDPDDPGRHVGRGNPLEGTSWLNRPWHFGLYYGALNGDDLIDRLVDQHTGGFGGARLGFDFDHYWGVEGRYGFANLRVTDTQAAQDGRHSRDSMWDVGLLYYPWGDSQWRPFLSWGLGWATFRFEDDQRRPVKDTTVQMPLGIGVKYYYRNGIALRLDLNDNLAFGSETVDAMHNLSVTMGVDFHFGGRRRSYFPWHPGIHPY